MSKVVSGVNVRSLFKRESVLEYRPIMGPDGVEWHWSLLPLPGETHAVASGHQKSKGLASVQARTEARALGYEIKDVRTVANPVSESTEDELVECPRCRGSKKSPDLPDNPCGCCEGTGTVTAKKREALQHISRDLRSRLASH